LLNKFIINFLFHNQDFFKLIIAVVKLQCKENNDPCQPVAEGQENDDNSLKFCNRFRTEVFELAGLAVSPTPFQLAQYSHAKSAKLINPSPHNRLQIALAC
jgi:hypothetical protein